MSPDLPPIVNDLRAARAASTASWFEGTVHELELYDPAGAGGSMIWAVWFEPGSRAKPHAHGFDQTLHVTEGEGVLATEEAASGGRSPVPSRSPTMNAATSRSATAASSPMPSAARCSA